MSGRKYIVNLHDGKDGTTASIQTSCAGEEETRGVYLAYKCGNLEIQRNSDE